VTTTSWTEARLVALTTAQIDEREGSRLEFKSSSILDEPNPSRKLGEVVSAFANATGGTIVIGVSERVDQATGVKTLFADDGLEDELRRREKISNVLADCVSPRLECAVLSIPLDSGRFAFAIEVPEGQIGQVYQAVIAQIFYRRHGEQSLATAEYEIRERYARASTPNVAMRRALSINDPEPMLIYEHKLIESIGTYRKHFNALTQGDLADDQ
jgi:predicted HTH transcriptional regulator